MSRSVALCVACAATLFAAAPPCQDEARVLAAFDKAFSFNKSKPGSSVEAKVAALEATVGLDSGKTVATLVDGWLDLDAELTLLDTERNGHSEEMATIMKGQEASENRTFPKPQFDRFNQLKDLVGKLRERGDALRALQLRVGDRIADLRRRDSVLWLLQHVCGNKKHAMPLRLAAARAVGGAAADVLEELAAALSHAKDPAEQIVLLDAMALAGAQAAAHSTPVIDLLQSKEEAVAERAALALARIAVVDGIGPMIELLSRSTAQSRLRVASALEVLTGQQFGLNVGAWQTWWQTEGPGFAASGAKLGQGVPSHRKETDKFYYFGIPQDQSSSLLYVIDCSGSMNKPVKMKDAEGQEVETSRLDGCKAELIRALGLLNPRQKFAILWYNDLPHFWEPKMQLAAKETVARAQAFVQTLKPASSTNIHDSLEQCFQLVGRGKNDRAYAVDLDTIFLLTDGSPTKPDGSLDSTDTILVGVREWNALHRVTIHTIAIGKDLNAAFLQKLASENGGEFKQF
ncbi:MAG TPA: VWA domain-containing protein [Planctomycetota bacterium]|nr:VWA domain-containing protein [Planctomycetota bacterium]